MFWFNIYGFIIVLILLLPNFIFALKNKDGFKNKFNNKSLEIFEQVGRFGCFIFMIINVPYTCFGWFFNNALIVYLIVNATLIIVYYTVWLTCLNKTSVFKVLSLSIVPSLIFLFSGVLTRSILLLVFVLIFAHCHIIISYKNSKQ